MSDSETVRVLQRVIEQQQRLITDLLDRIAYMQGQPWNLPERPDYEPAVVEREARTYTSSPEQEPVY